MFSRLLVFTKNTLISPRDHCMFWNGLVVEVKHRTLYLVDLSIHFQHGSLTMTSLGYGFHILQDDVVVVVANSKNPPPKKKQHMVSEKHQSYVGSHFSKSTYKFIFSSNYRKITDLAQWKNHISSFKISMLLKFVEAFGWYIYGV